MVPRSFEPPLPNTSTGAGLNPTVEELSELRLDRLLRQYRRFREAVCGRADDYVITAVIPH